MSLDDCKKVEITFHKANELPKADLIGKIDAYATCVAASVISEVPVRLAQSAVIKKDFDPKWDETLTFNASGAHPMKLQIYDWDKISKDDLVAEVEIPFEECDQKKLDMEVLIKNKKKKEPTITVSIKIADVEKTGIFALIPALKEAGLDVATHPASQPAGGVHVVANLESLVHADVHLSFTFAPSGTAVGVKLLRASGDRSVLARLARGEQPLDGTLVTFTSPTSVDGVDVIEYFEALEKFDVAGTDWSQLTVLMETVKTKRQETHQVVATAHGYTPGSFDETPEDRAARLGALTQAHVQGSQVFYEWHHNKQEPNPVKAIAGLNDGQAVTKIVSDKSHKYLGDVTLSGNDASTRVITSHPNVDTSVGGITVGVTTTMDTKSSGQNVLYSLYRLKSYHPEGGEKVAPVPLTSFSKFS